MVQSEYIIIQDAKEGGAFCPNQTASPSEQFFFSAACGTCYRCWTAHLSVSKAMKKRTAGCQELFATVTLSPSPTAKRKRLKVTDRARRFDLTHYSKNSFLENAIFSETADT